jgi:Domain of unknown function (DUF4336)
MMQTNLREIALDVWVAEQPLRFAGLELGARMTVIRLQNGELLLHSPIAYSPELATAIEALGKPTFIIAPNRFHHMFVGEWAAAYPHCQIHVAPGLQKKRQDLPVARVLTASNNLDFSDQIPHVLMAGYPFASEVVLFHHKSATLVTSDLIFNIGGRHAFGTRLAFRCLGAYGRPSSTLLERMMVKDRDQFHQSMEQVLQWPIDKLIMAHGDIVGGDGDGALRQAYQWLLRK